MTRSAVPLSHRVAEAAYQLHSGVELALLDVLAELDLTLPLADLLLCLDPAVGPLSRRELAIRLRCDPSNVTFLANRLEHRRLITRSRRGEDRRVRALSLTPAGARVRRRLVATIAEAPMFDQLTLAEQRHLLDLLVRCGRYCQ